MVHISELTWWINLIFVLLESLYCVLSKNEVFLWNSKFSTAHHTQNHPSQGQKWVKLRISVDFESKNVERMVWKHVSLGAKLNGHGPLTHF